MKRRILALALILAMLLPCLMGEASAATSGKCGKNATWKFDASTGTLTISGSGEIMDISKYDISEFESRKQVRTLVIEEGITTIDGWMFYAYNGLDDGVERDDYSNLTVVHLPLSMKYIEESAFEGCRNITTVYYPGTPEQRDQIVIEEWNRPFNYWATWYFGENKELMCETSGTCGENLTWWYDEKTRTLTISGTGGMYNYGYYIENDFPRAPWTGLPVQTLVINNGMTRIGDHAFMWEDELKTVYLPESVQTIGPLAFGFKRVEDVFYSGTKAKSKDIVYQDDIGCFDKVTWHYNNIMSPVIKCSVDAASGKPSLTWPSVSGAEKYRIYRAASKSGNYEYLGSTSRTNYTDKTAAAGKIYYYKIKAQDTDSKNYSGWSNVVSCVCTLAKPEVSISYSAASGKPIVKWKTVRGAVKYSVYRSTRKNSGYEKVYTGVNARSYTDKTAKAGTNYYYKVKAIHSNSSANSAYSEVVNRVCDLAKPSVTLTRTASGNPWVKWGAVKDADGYEVWRATSKSGTYKKVKTTTSGTSFADRDVKAGRTYYYKVRAIHDKTSANSAYSSIKSITAK